MLYETIVKEQKKFCKECTQSCKGCYMPEFARKIAYAILDIEVADLRKLAFHNITLLREGHDQ